MTGAEEDEAVGVVLLACIRELGVRAGVGADGAEDVVAVATEDVDAAVHQQGGRAHLVGEVPGDVAGLAGTGPVGRVEEAAGAEDVGLAAVLQQRRQASAPALAPKTWYGMPAYAKDGKVVCFFRSGEKFKERYMTLGFNDVANLDDGRMWPVAFALTELNAAEEERIAALVKKAVN